MAVNINTGATALPKQLQPTQPNQPTQLQVQPGQFGPPTAFGEFGGNQADIPQSSSMRQQALNPQTQFGGNQQQQQQLTQAAQQQAMQPPQNQTLQQLQASAGQLLQDPLQGLNQQQQRSLQMDQFNRSMANQMEALRQGTADRFNQGGRLLELTDAARMIGQQRADTSRAIDIEQANQRRQAQLAAINAGLPVSEQSRLQQAQNMQGLATAAGIAEPGLQRGFAAEQEARGRAADILQQQGQISAAENLARLQGNIESGLIGTRAGAAENLERLRGSIQQTLSRQDFEQSGELTKLRVGLQQKADESLARLQGNIEAGLIGTRADYQESLEHVRAGIEQALSRQDFQQASQLTQLKAQLEQQATEDQQKHDLLMQSVGIEGQKALETIRGKIESGLLAERQDYDVALRELDSELAESAAQNDFARMTELETLRSDLEQKQQQAAQQWQTSERVASQQWQTGEAISEREHDMAVAYLNTETQKAMQENDIQMQERLADNRAKLDLALQANEMGHEERMTYLNSQLAEARATNDVTRQRQIMEFGHQQNLETMAKQFGHEAALNRLQSQMRIAEQNNDYVNQQALQNARLEFEGSQRFADRQIEQARLDMQQQGINADQFFARYEAIAAQNPDEAERFLREGLRSVGFEMAEFDETQAVQDALRAQQSAMRAQWAATHPEAVADPATGELTPEGISQFNSYFNEAMYGEGGEIENVMDAASIRAGTDSAETLKAEAQAWRPDVRVDGRGFWSPDVRTFQNAPSVGTPFTWKDRTLVATTEVAEETRGQNYQWFMAKDLDTGEIIKMRADDPWGMRG